MWYGFSKPTRRDWMVVAAGLMLVAMLGVMPPLGADGPDADATGPAPMSAEAATVYAAWQEHAGYFAAFALSETGRAWGWSATHNTMIAAETNALARCDRNGAGCRVIDRRADPSGGQLGSAAAKDQLSRFRGTTGTGAYAMSENGASYWVAGRGTVAQAEAEALAGCNERRRKNQPDFLPDWPCRIIERRAR